MQNRGRIVISKTKKKKCNSQCIQNCAALQPRIVSSEGMYTAQDLWTHRDQRSSCVDLE